MTTKGPAAEAVHSRRKVLAALGLGGGAFALTGGTAAAQSTTQTTPLVIDTGDPSTVPLLIRTAPDQSANAFELRNPADELLASFQPTGPLAVGGTSVGNVGRDGTAGISFGGDTRWYRAGGEVAKGIRTDNPVGIGQGPDMVMLDVKGSARLAIKDDPPAGPELIFEGHNGEWVIGIDSAAAVPSRDWFLAKVVPGGVNDFVYVSHNGDEPPTMSVGSGVPHTNFRLNVAPDATTPNVGGLLVRSMPGQAAKAFAVRYGYSDSGLGGDFFAVLPDGTLQMRDADGNNKLVLEINPAGAFTQPLVLTNNLAVDTNTLFVDSVNAHSAGFKTTTPEAGSVAHFGFDPGSWVKFGRDATYGLRIGSQQSGNQWLAVGVNKTASDNVYRAKSNNNGLVNHRIIELGYDGRVAFKYAPHANDGVALSPVDQLVVGADSVALSTPKVGFFSKAPATQPPAIANLNGNPKGQDVADRVNSILAALRNLGLISS